MTTAGREFITVGIRPVLSFRPWILRQMNLKQLSIKGSGDGMGKYLYVACKILKAVLFRHPKTGLL